MPPRKRARHSRNTTATASPSPSAITPSAVTHPAVSPSAVTPSKSSPPPTTAEDVDMDMDNDNDPWTDAEESALFRGLLRIKPTGIHKHANMMTLHAWLAENHHIHPANEHTRIPGIWAKLATLYDLAALDAREEARQLETIPGLEEEGVVLDGEWSEVENLVEVGEFALPVSEDEGVRREVWGRRLRGKKDDGEESEAEMPELNLRSTPPRVLDLRTGVEPSLQGKNGKGRVKKGREAHSQAQDSRRGILVPSRRSARQAESTADEAEVDEGQEQKEKEEDQGAEEEEEVDDSEDKESRASTPATRSTRSKGVAIVKGGMKGKSRTKAKAK